MMGDKFTKEYFKEEAIRLHKENQKLKSISENSIKIQKENEKLKLFREESMRLHKENEKLKENQLDKEMLEVSPGLLIYSFTKGDLETMSLIFSALGDKNSKLKLHKAGRAHMKELAHKAAQLKIAILENEIKK